MLERVATATDHPAARARPDSHLLALGRRLAIAWANERAMYARAHADDSPANERLCDAAVDISKAIVDEIESLPATTFAGLRVKALAVSWCHAGAATEAEAFNKQATTNVRLAASIVRDLLAARGDAHGR